MKPKAPVTQADIARALGLSRSTITKLKGQGMPTTSIEAAQAWRTKHQSIAARKPAPSDSKSTPSSAPDDVPDFNASRALREFAEARMAELRCKTLEETLIDKQEVEAVLARQCSAVRDGLLQLPARIAPAVANETDISKIQHLIDRELRQILAQLVGVSA